MVWVENRIDWRFRNHQTYSNRTTLGDFKAIFAKQNVTFKVMGEAVTILPCLRSLWIAQWETLISFIFCTVSMLIYGLNIHFYLYYWRYFYLVFGLLIFGKKSSIHIMNPKAFRSRNTGYYAFSTAYRGPSHEAWALEHSFILLSHAFLLLRPLLTW